jgi:magnesium-transporting ATPase (P-type)
LIPSFALSSFRTQKTFSHNSSLQLFFSSPPPQLLWVNLIMDTLAALALATEVPTPELLLRRPYGRFDRLVSNRMWFNIFAHAIFQITLLLIMLFLGERIYLNGIDHKDKRDVNYTMVFNSFVFFQVKCNATQSNTTLSGVF